MTGPSDIVLVDDHRSVRDMLRAALSRPREGAPAYRVVGEGGTGEEAVELCLRLRPRLLVLDLVFPGGINGLEAFLQLTPRLRGGLRVVFFSGCQQEALISQALLMGAAGYVSKAQPLQTLLDAVALVDAGQQYFDPEVAHLLNRPRLVSGTHLLTKREREVARLVAQGKTTKEAAGVLGISVKTLDKHRSRMMKKLNLHDAVGVTRYALQAGLVSLP